MKQVLRCGHCGSLYLGDDGIAYCNKHKMILTDDVTGCPGNKENSSLGTKIIVTCNTNEEVKELCKLLDEHNKNYTVEVKNLTLDPNIITL